MTDLQSNSENRNKSLPLDLWRQIFKALCQQVERIELDSSADQLNIFVKGRHEALQANHHELDDALHKYNNNVQEVVTSFMKTHGVIDIYQNTLVGFFDIQAYSSFVEGTDFKDAIWKTNNLITKIKSAARSDILDVYAAATCLAYSLGSIALYWSILRWLRRNGLIERLWNDQVLDAKKSRVSVGTVLSLLDHLHIILVFGGVFLFAVNALFWFEPKKTWLQALYMGLMAFNLKGFDDFPIPETEVARAICAGLSILSVLFVGFLATAFLKPFVIVFRHK